jgi:hypothetical protein
VCGESALADAGRPHDQHAGPALEAAAEQLVETRHITAQGFVGRIVEVF